jgi:hypothetical protein
MILTGLFNKEFIQPLEQLKLRSASGYFFASVDPARSNYTEIRQEAHAVS